MEIAYAFPEFSVYDLDTAERWTDYTTKMKYWFKLRRTENGLEQLFFLLFTAGKHIQQLYQRVKAPGDSETFNDIVKKMANHFNPTSNVTMHIYTLHAMSQLEEETFNEFYARLQEKITFCGFPDQAFELKHQIIQGCVSTSLRKYALSNPIQTLNQLVERGMMDGICKLTGSLKVATS